MTERGADEGVFFRMRSSRTDPVSVISGMQAVPSGWWLRGDRRWNQTTILELHVRRVEVKETRIPDAYTPVTRELYSTNKRIVK